MIVFKKLDFIVKEIFDMRILDACNQKYDDAISNEKLVLKTCLVQSLKLIFHKVMKNELFKFV